MKHKQKRCRLIREFGKHFFSSGGALTLTPEEIGKHKDGWTITGEIKEDYFEWVNEFEATHPKLGRVYGNFEDKVYATSLKAFNDFYEKHTPSAWDYGDI